MTICLTLRLCFSNQSKDVFDVVARINHHGFARGFVPDHRAIALQRADGKDFVDHGL